VAGWHAGCIILGNMACFVTWEMPILDVNEPPEVIAWTQADGELISYHEDLGFYLAAQDTDSDEDLLFLWQADNSRLFDVSYRTSLAEDTGEAGGIWMSEVTVPWDEDLDGAELTVQILDASGGTTRASWTLEVL